MTDPNAPHDPNEGQRPEHQPNGPQHPNGTQQPAGDAPPPPPPPASGQTPPPYGATPPPYGQQHQGGQYHAGQYQNQYQGQYQGQPNYQGPYNAAPPLSPQSDKQAAMWAHLGGGLGALITWGWGGWIVPLIIYLVNKDRGPFTRQEAKEALNFQITVAIFSVGLNILGFILAIALIGFLLFPIAWIAALLGVIFGIIGGVKVNNGEAYRYFWAIRMVK